MERNFDQISCNVCVFKRTISQYEVSKYYLVNIRVFSLTAVI